MEMAKSLIYFLFIVVSYVRSSESYFLNYDLDTNLPEQFSDPIDENWQDKRSVGNEHSSLFKRHFLFPKAYRGSTLAHDEVGTSDLQKRESEMERNDEVEEKFDESDSNLKNSFHEADARQILSKFSNSDREALNSLMNNEGPYIDVDKRQSLKQNFENSYHLNKRNNFKVPCKGVECENDDQNSVLSEDDGYNYCPGTDTLKTRKLGKFYFLFIEKVIAKRKPKFKRSSHFRSTPRENILQAKISILKDNYKRSSESEKLNIKLFYFINISLY